jgi:hypothetical protein
MSIGLVAACVLIALAYIGMCIELTFEIMEANKEKDPPTSMWEYRLGCVFVFIMVLLFGLFMRAIFGYAIIYTLIRPRENQTLSNERNVRRFFPDSAGNYRGKYTLQDGDLIDGDALFKQMPVHSLVMVEVPKGVMAYLQWHGDVRLIESNTYYLARSPIEIVLTEVPDVSSVTEETLFTFAN